MLPRAQPGVRCPREPLATQTRDPAFLDIACRVPSGPPHPEEDPVLGTCFARRDDDLFPERCEDYDLCTHDVCLAGGGCSHELSAACDPCFVDEECDDLDACTLDSCAPGRWQCSHEPVGDCRACAVDAECAGVDFCSSGRCEEGRCLPIRWFPDPHTGPACGGEGCQSDCDDGDATTTELCVTGDGACLAFPSTTVPGYRCADDAQCFTRGDPCETRRCVEGSCLYEPIPGCTPQPCARGADCDDGRGCTLDLCLDGECHWPVLGPPCCAAASDCVITDSTAPECAVSHCDVDERCRRSPLPEPLRCGDHCASDGDCARRCDPETGACASFCVRDASCHDWPCAEGFCGAGGRCVWFDGDCRPCADDTDCVDGRPTTIDRCDGGACVHDPDPDATPVACDATRPCDSPDPCTLGICLPSQGCLWLPNPRCEN